MRVQWLPVARGNPNAWVGVATGERRVAASLLRVPIVTRLDDMLGPTFHHLHETIRYLAEVINLPAGYCVGLIGLLVTLGLAVVIVFSHRRRAA